MQNNSIGVRTNFNYTRLDMFGIIIAGSILDFRGGNWAFLLLIQVLEFLITLR